MKATNLAEALTIFASYDKDIEVVNQLTYLFMLQSKPSSLESMTKQSVNKLKALGWTQDNVGTWVIEVD